MLKSMKNRVLADRQLRYIHDIVTSPRDVNNFS